MDDVLLGKAAIIERCLRRITEEYHGHEAEFATNFTRQDAILLNLQRACEAAIDGAMHLVRTHRLGVPTESRQAFVMLAQAGMVDAMLGQRLAAMVGFRTIAVHAYQDLDMAMVQDILHHRLDDLRAFARLLVARGSAPRSF